MKCYLLNLPDDCGCRAGLHDGVPHWLHEDRQWYIRNLHILERGGRYCLRAYALEEANRLHEKSTQMARLVCGSHEVVWPDGYRENTDYSALREALFDR